MSLILDLPVLIYDGDCGFCTTSANWISSRWPDGAALALPYQRMSLDTLSRFGLSRDDVTSKAWWVEPSGRSRGGAAAVAAALVAAGGSLALIGWLLRLPPISWLARPGYRLVARYRYKLPGATADCKL